MKNSRNYIRHLVGLISALVGLASWVALPGYALQPNPAFKGVSGASWNSISPTERTPSWAFTGSLGTSRYSHTATLLENGQVLVAGGFGFGFCDIKSSAELYDLSTGKWRYTSSLNTARYGHTATLLPSGNVLVIGGGTCSSRGFGPSGSAELYDPATGTWSYTGNLNTAGGGTATLLPNGKVLVAGGGGGGNDSSAEMYDPATGTWSITGSLNVARYIHTATLLPNGKVLVAGNSNGSSAELYDPATGTWSITGSLNVARYIHTATLLPNGKVLVAGGVNSDAPSSGFTNSVELYDPDTGTWSITGNLHNARVWHTATLLENGKVLAAGGNDESDTSLASAELYDPATGTWSTTSSLLSPRSLHTAMLLPDGKVLVTGGRAGEEGDFTLNSVEMYGPIAIPRINSTSVAGKKLFILGENFDIGAVILLNGEEQRTKNDDQNPKTTLIGKKAGKRIKPGDKLQVRNFDGALSQEFFFTG